MIAPYFSQCHRCRFFYITYDARYPYGCRALGFKSRHLPMEEVYRSSGIPCLYFKKKERQPGVR
ncbi:MAG: uracil-DNA glycosylase [Desulfobacterota bacterium]|nr:uracil-DNA glycosylase [Thermodesulfobacteriota bacterium]